MSYQPPQQPFTQYPPPPQSPPQQKPSFWKRKVGCLPVWALILIAVLACYAVGSAALYHPTTTISRVSSALTPPAITVTPIPTDTPLPTVAPAKWTTTHTFTGSGEKTTATFNASGDWKLIWTAKASSYSEAFFGVSVYSNGEMIDSGADATIPAGKKMTDSTDEHTDAGSFYLKVYAGIPWTIQVQELK